MPLKKHLRIALHSGLLSLSLSACGSEPVQEPTPEQQTALGKLHQRCDTASLDENGHLKHLAELRHDPLRFTCDELKQACEQNFVSKVCISMRTVTTVQNAYEVACRSGGPSSTGCKALAACNLQGFASAECQTAIVPYNR